MRWKPALLITLAALSAAVLGLAASVAVYGPAPLLSSPLGSVLERFLPGGDRRGALSPGDPVPAWRLPDLAGTPHEVAARGQVTLVNYWASWCAPCREELPLLDAFSRGPGGRVRVVAIALDTAAQAQAFLQSQTLQLDVLIEDPSASDSSVALGNRHGVLPFSVLIGADGRLIARKTGAFQSRADLEHWAGQADLPP